MKVTCENCSVRKNPLIQATKEVLMLVEFASGTTSKASTDGMNEPIRIKLSCPTCFNKILIEL